MIVPETPRQSRICSVYEQQEEETHQNSGTIAEERHETGMSVPGSGTAHGSHAEQTKIPKTATQQTTTKRRETSNARICAERERQRQMVGIIPDAHPAEFQKRWRSQATIPEYPR